VTCCASVLAAAFNLVLAGVLGTRGRLNALDITMYMSLPSALFLLPPIFFVPHPAQWPGADAVTDWQVWKMVATLSPKTSIALLVSGWLAICNNLLQYWLVQRLNATHTAFAGNVNKAVTITLSMALGVETLPGGAWSIVMIMSVLGNVVSFAGYTVIKATHGIARYLDPQPASHYRRSSSRLRLNSADSATTGRQTPRGRPKVPRMWSSEEQTEKADTEADTA